jgi:hypothetical protein
MSGATRKTRMSRKMGKGSRRAAWIGGLAVAGAAAAGLAIMLTSKKASAAPLPPAPSPSGPVLDTELKRTAHTMNAAIAQNGYSAADVPIYQAFQTAAGLKADGWPGQGTYNALVAALKTIPETPSSNLNPNYTFMNPPGWNGVSAPTTTQWWGPGYTGSTAIGPVATAGGTNTPYTST